MIENNMPSDHIKPIQLILPLDIERMIDTYDSIYTFNEIMDNVDLSKYYTIGGVRKKGRNRYNPETLLKLVLFAFMDDGYASCRSIEKSCKTDIRFLWLLGGLKAPSFMTINNFTRNCLQKSVEEIFLDVNRYIFEQQNVCLDAVYIDGTKIEATSNKYTWVWKNSSKKYRDKTFAKITLLIGEINGLIESKGEKEFGTREEYSIEYAEQILREFSNITGLSPDSFVHGAGHRKTKEQRLYEKFYDCIRKLQKYSMQIRICGEKRNSYSKTDHDATFMRVKKDYMGNDQLLPAYNMQVAVADGYVATYGAYCYASDTDCFVPLMEKFRDQYGFYPKYPTADAGYGSYNNYLYCENNGMEKYLKFPTYEKEKHNPKYRDNPFRAVNFRTDSEGRMICPNEKPFHYIGTRPIKGNKYDRKEEYYQCDSCEGCPYRQKCHKSKKNRIISLNRELTKIHEEVMENLNTEFGIRLRINRSIQAEGTFGLIKWNREYKRLRRRGMDRVEFELGLICCGLNMHKYHLSKAKKTESVTEEVA